MPHPTPHATVPLDRLDRFLLPADVGFSRSPKWYARAIRFFTRSKGEPPTYAHHTFGIGPLSEIVEARSTVTRTPIPDWKAPAGFEIWRHLGLTATDRAAISLYAARREGSFYGGFKILAHLADSLITKLVAPDHRSVHFFRKLCFLPDYPICSWLCGYAYESRGWGLRSCPARFASPDDQHDWVSSNRHWHIVAKREHKKEVAAIWVPGI